MSKYATTTVPAEDGTHNLMGCVHSQCHMVSLGVLMAATEQHQYGRHCNALHLNA